MVVFVEKRDLFIAARTEYSFAYKYVIVSVRENHDSYAPNCPREFIECNPRRILREILFRSPGGSHTVVLNSIWYLPATCVRTQKGTGRCAFLEPTGVGPLPGRSLDGQTRKRAEKLFCGENNFEKYRRTDVCGRSVFYRVAIDGCAAAGAVVVGRTEAI